MSFLEASKKEDMFGKPLKDHSPENCHYLTYLEKSYSQVLSLFDLIQSYLYEESFILRAVENAEQQIFNITAALGSDNS